MSSTRTLWITPLLLEHGDAGHSIGPSNMETCVKQQSSATSRSQLHHSQMPRNNIRRAQPAALTLCGDHILDAVRDLRPAAGMLNNTSAEAGWNDANISCHDRTEVVVR